MFNFEEGLKSIWESDETSQIEFMKFIGSVREIDWKYLRELGCVFIPNNKYMSKYFPTQAQNYMCDIYNKNGKCKWDNYMITPIKSITGETVAFAGYSPIVEIAKHDDEDLGFPKYAVSNRLVFDRNKFALLPRGFDKAFEDEYIIVVDGYWDAIRLSSLGFNSFCNLGSEFGDCLYLLNFIKRVYVAYDNDEAGVRLYNGLKARLPNVKKITQGLCKDIDQFSKIRGGEYLRSKLNILSNKQFNDNISLD